jgi:AhpD family alkylhydroperoxidase
MSTARHPIRGDVLGLQPEATTAFWRLYGTLWSHGTVALPTKEVARLRNARTTGCRYCQNVRFEGARDAGLTEDRVALIHDEFDSTELSAEEKTAIRFVDSFLADPHGVSDPQRQELLEHFDAGQLVELTAGVALFMGFSKIAVALGPPPDMPTLVVPTPDWPPAGDDGQP